ncbi:FAD-dependent oxidoreductase [Thermodesulfobacteriota bacterium]
MIEAVFMMGGLGLLVGVGLAMASKIFYVYVDPLIVAVDEALPGANCGGCGLPGCSANAEAIVSGKASPNSCVAAGPEVAEAIAAILGVAIEAKEPDIARPGCTYGLQTADIKYFYDGLGDCRAAALINGGMKVCRIGCLGLGTCAKVCPFDAITMGANGLPVVDEVKCTGCGTCERVCPKHIITLSSVTRRIIREYTTEDCTTPCQRACPAGIDICEYIQQIQLKNYARSVQIIKERNPFPTVIGRICPRPCEDVCRRQLLDEPVAINFLKRFVADYEKEKGERILPFKAPDTGRKIAVMGGGVQGLSTAFFAARLGHAPTVFEATQKLGGLLRSAIAKNRLPHDVLNWDIDGIIEMGVAARTGQCLGKDISIHSLLNDGFDAVFLSLGGWDSRLSRGADAKAEKPVPGLHLLMDVSKSLKQTTPPDITCGKHTILAGGGELAVQTAILCKENGVDEVTVIFRESTEDNGLSTEILDKATEKGIHLIFGAGINRIFGEKDQLNEIEYFDQTSKTMHTLPANTLVIASGRFPEFIFSKPTIPESDIQETDTQETPSEEEKITSDAQWEGFYAVKHPHYNSEMGLLAEGDVLSDYSGAIKAIGAGRRAAASIHNVIYGIPLSHPDNVLTLTTMIQNVNKIERVEQVSRTIMQIADASERLMDTEIEKGFTEKKAQREAARCLQCGLICYEKTGTNNR